MKSSRALCVLLCSLSATTLFAIDFCKVPGLQGEAKDPAHAGWIEIKSFSWGGNPGAKGPKCAATNEATFVTGGSPAAEAQLMQMCASHQQVPQLTVDVNGERHVLEQIAFTTCRNGLDGPTHTFVIRYHDCALHVAPIVAQVISEKTGTQSVMLVSLRFNGKSGTVILQNDLGGGGASFFSQAYQSKQPTPNVTIKANSQTWTFTNMLVSGYQQAADGKQTFTFSFNTMSGPLGGVQRP